MNSLYFSRDEYEERWNRAHTEMRRRGYGSAVVWGRGAGTHERCGDLLYLTNYYSAHSGHEPDCSLWQGRSFAALILQDGETPHLHMGEPLEKRDWIATDRTDWHMDLIEGVAGELNRRNLKGKVALVGSDFFPTKYMRDLESRTPDLTWIPEDDLVGVTRRLKSARELDVFREAGETVTKGLNVMMEGLIGGSSQREAAAEAVKIVFARGGVPTLVRCQNGVGDVMNDLASEPLTGASDQKPRSGDIVRGYLMGPMCRGYWLDPLRTAVCGRKPTGEQRDLIETCARICETVMAAQRPGVRATEIAELGDRLFEEAGVEQDQCARQWPLYGHGLGLFWERPVFGSGLCTDDEVIEPSMVLSSEVFVARKGVGAAGFEQNFIVREQGNELITTTPMFWWD